MKKFSATYSNSVFGNNIIRPKKFNQIHKIMLRHNLLLTLRNFKRFKSTFFINLIGLSTGLACVLFIYLWVADELSMDKFHVKRERLYQILFNMESNQGIQTGKLTPVPLAAALVEKMPEVELAVSIDDFTSWRNREGILSNTTKHIKAKGMHASKDFFNVFSFSLLAGNKNQVLEDKSSIVISEELAKKLFDTIQNAIGKSLEWSHPGFEGTFVVSGVFAPRAKSSMAPFDVIFNMDVLLERNEMAGQWQQNWCQTFVILKKGTNAADFNQKINRYLKERNDMRSNAPLLVQKYSDTYLHGQYENGVPVSGRFQYIRLFSLIAIFIILIACVNFINLSTARASQRMKEIGVKKAIGANRSTLIFQYLSESVILAFLALFIALGVVAMLLPQFDTITGKQLTLMMDSTGIVIMLGIVLVTGLCAGLYPALYLSGFKAVNVLKKKLDTSAGELWVRKGLVVFQFSLAVVFIVGFLVITKQIKYIQTKNLGYSKDNIITFQWKGKLDNRFETFVSGLKAIRGVVNATTMSGNILTEIWGQSAVSWRGREEDRGYVFKSPVVGYDFIETLGIKMLAGRSYQKNYGNEWTNIILNEAAVKMMGLKHPVGTSIQWEDKSRQIIGVVKDFHYGSLHDKVDPLIFRFNPNGETIMVKINAGMEKNTLEKLKEFHHEFLPLYPFEFTFMDDDYAALYKSESRVAVLSNYVAALSILISCLGLFGLAAFTAERRRKEIGVRKVLGSTLR